MGIWQSTRESIAVMPQTNWGLPYRRRLSSLCPVSNIHLRARDILSVVPFYRSLRVIHGQQLCDDSTFSLGNFLCIGHGQKAIEAPERPAHPRGSPHALCWIMYQMWLGFSTFFMLLAPRLPKHLNFMSSQHLDLAGLQTCARRNVCFFFVFFFLQAKSWKKAKPYSSIYWMIQSSVLHLPPTILKERYYCHLLESKRTA